MRTTITDGAILRAARLAWGVACLALGGCASSSDTSFLLLADPGKYQYHNCKQLADARKNVVNRQQNLQGLIDKAEQGAGGVLVGAIAYRSEYAAVGQELRVIDATARDKNCPPPPPDAPPPT